MLTEYLVMSEEGHGAVFVAPTLKQAQWGGQRYANEAKCACALFVYASDDFISLHFPIETASNVVPLFTKITGVTRLSVQNEND